MSDSERGPGSQQEKSQREKDVASIEHVLRSIRMYLVGYEKQLIEDRGLRKHYARSLEEMLKKVLRTYDTLEPYPDLYALYTPQLEVLVRDLALRVVPRYVQEGEESLAEYEAQLVKMAIEPQPGLARDDGGHAYGHVVESFRDAVRTYHFVKTFRFSSLPRSPRKTVTLDVGEPENGVVFEEEERLKERMERLRLAVINYLVPSLEVGIVTGRLTSGELLKRLPTEVVNTVVRGLETTAVREPFSEVPDADDEDAPF